MPQNSVSTTWPMLATQGALASLIVASTATAGGSTHPPTLFTNVQVFDGVNEKLIKNANVLVEGNLIKQVSTSAISAEGATVIDGKRRTLMPAPGVQPLSPIAGNM